MARELDDAILRPAHQRARHRHLAAQDRGRRRRACSRCDATLLAHQRPLARARDASACCAARFARLDVSVAHAVRADRAGLVLRRHAARARARRRPQLHAGAARRRRRGAEARARRRSTSARYPMVNGQSAPAAPLLRRSGAARRGCARRIGTAARRRRGAARSASSPRRPTTSTGTTRSASRIEERAAHVARRADRHGGEPALRRPGEHGDAHLRPPHRLAELDLPAARTPSARRARSRSTAPATRPPSTGTASERAPPRNHRRTAP